MPHTLWELIWKPRFHRFTSVLPTSLRPESSEYTAEQSMYQTRFCAATNPPLMFCNQRWRGVSTLIKHSWTRHCSYDVLACLLVTQGNVNSSGWPVRMLRADQYKTKRQLKYPKRDYWSCWKLCLRKKRNPIFYFKISYSNNEVLCISRWHVRKMIRVNFCENNIWVRGWCETSIWIMTWNNDKKKIRVLNQVRITILKPKVSV